MHMTILTSRLNSNLIKPGVTEGVGLSCEGVVGPDILHRTVDQHVYQDVLTGTAIPHIRQMNENVYFQQDGAPPHYALTVRALLDKEFPNKWIGRRGPIEWPPRSPDLTPIDFLFLGIFHPQTAVC